MCCSFTNGQKDYVFSAHVSKEMNTKCLHFLPHTFKEDWRHFFMLSCSKDVLLNKNEGKRRKKNIW